MLERYNQPHVAVFVYSTNPNHPVSKVMSGKVLYYDYNNDSNDNYYNIE